MTAPLDIQRLRELLAAATPGPWHAETSWRLAGAISATLDGHSRQVASADGQAPQFDPQQRNTADLMRANAGLICAAVNALPELLAIAEAAFDVYNDFDPDEIKPMTTSIRHLYAAVDAARKAGT